MPAPIITTTPGTWTKSQDGKTVSKTDIVVTTWAADAFSKLNTTLQANAKKASDIAIASAAVAATLSVSQQASQAQQSIGT